MAISPNPGSSKAVRTLLEKIIETYSDFDYYKDTMYTNLARPAIFWPDGRSLGYGFASHISGSAQKFYEKFKYWGFESLRDFYCLPVEKRNEFLEVGKALWKHYFGEQEFKQMTIKSALNIENQDIAAQDHTLLSLQEAESQFRSKLASEASKIKQECHSSPYLKRRIENEKARFLAEDKYRERASELSGTTAELFHRSFQVAEEAKRKLGMREPFPSRGGKETILRNV